MRTWLVVGLLLALALPQACLALDWPMSDQSEVVTAANLEPGKVENGRLSGSTAWDPYFWLRLPEEGFDARKTVWLEARIYSSEPADLLDVYYKSADGRWCLGGRLPISRGWAVYRQDLSKNAWRETTAGDVARQWGGPSHQVGSFRLDPGNEAGRTVMVDYVRLTELPANAVEGVTPEPRGTARIDEVRLPTTIRAGGTLDVKVGLTVTLPPELQSLNTYVRLTHGDEVIASREQTIQRRDDTRYLGVEASLPLSAYWYPGTYAVQVGAYELDPVPGQKPLARDVEFVNPLVGTVKPPVVKLQQVGGDPAIIVNGKPLPGLMFCLHGGDSEKLHREIAGTGIHLYADWFGASTGSDMGHISPDRYDYSAFDRYFARILSVDPQALFVPHIGVTAPQWWQKLHPEELAVYADGKTGPSSFASQLWKQEMGEDLRKLLAHLRRAPYADRLIGYTFYGGYTAEWQMWGTWAEHKDDYSVPATKAFRAFLAARYHDDATLRQAWRDPQVTLATATVPDAARRRPGGPQVLRDPATERQAIDWYDFASEMDADALLHFARLTREATGGEALVGTYYGYLSAHGANQSDSGHNAAARVFDSPYLDFLMSPPNYAFRRAGESSTFMSATDSLRLRGKLWLDEADNRTFLSDVSAGFGRSDNIADTLGVLYREHAEVLTKRAAVSYFDMGGGWYSHPDLLWNLAKVRQLSEQSLQGRRPFTPQVCLLVDPGSFSYLRPTEAMGCLVRENLVHMPLSGVPFDYCLLSDLGQKWLPDYKLYVFLNAVRVDARTRALIDAKLKRNGATGVFLYAPGYFEGSTGSLSNMERLTGVKLAALAGDAGPARLQFAAGEALAAGLDTAAPAGAELPVTPRFYAADPQAQVHAKLAGTDCAGLVSKRTAAGWTAVYSSAMDLPPALWRNLARQAGAHVWLDTDDALYADSRYVGVHAAADGEKVIHLPRACKVSDALTGRELAVTDKQVRFALRKGETKLLEMK